MIWHFLCALLVIVAIGAVAAWILHVSTVLNATLAMRSLTRELTSATGKHSSESDLELLLKSTRGHLLRARFDYEHGNYSRSARIAWGARRELIDTLYQRERERFVTSNLTD